MPNVGDLATFLLILAIFYGACTETPISELLATIRTTPLDSATLISYKNRKFRQSVSTYGRFGPFLFAHAQKNISAIGVLIQFFFENFI